MFLTLELDGDEW